MAKYVDGFVVPVPKTRLAAYKAMSKKAGKVWMEHGALQYVESVGEDMEIKGTMPFPKQMRLKRGETVVFAWILYKSKAHRNAVNKKVMSDPRIANFNMSDNPFDAKRMVYGGFNVMIEG